MNISSLLTSKYALGVVGGIGSAATGGLVYHIKWSGTFDGRVSKTIWDLGLSKDWCTRNENKYVCDKSKNDENLKKIIFASRHNNIDEYKIEGSHSNAEIEIRNEKDIDTFPGGIKFVIVGNTSNQNIQIKRSTDEKAKLYPEQKWSPETVNIWPKGSELKVDNRKVSWVWEELNDLAKKVGLYCEEKAKDEKPENNSTCYLLENQKINIKDGDKVTEEATIESNKRISFDRMANNFFQGYKFTPKEDIPLKSNGKEVTEGDKVTKLEKSKSYQIIRDEKDINKWYLTKV